MSMQGAGQMQNMKLMKDRMEDMKTQAEEMGKTVATMRHMYELMTQLVGVTHDMVTRDERPPGNDPRIAGPHRGFRRLLPADPQLLLLGTALLQHPGVFVDRGPCSTPWTDVSELTDTMDSLIVNMHQLDALMPQMVAQFGPMIAKMENMQRMMMTTYSTMSGMLQPDGRTDAGTPRPWVRRSTKRRTTTRSICHRKCFRQSRTFSAA